MSKKTGFLSFLKESIPEAIWAIGISSLLMNVSTAVVFSGTALYLKTVLGVAISAIGFIEAIVEAIAYAVRIFSGVISDYFRKRKTMMMIGFVMLAISKPLLAFSKTFAHIFISRAIDRVGNGIQASPREALISDLSPKESKGACFGLRQSLSVIGSTLGALFGIIVMKSTNNNFELMFLLAGIPAVIAVFILLIFVKEKKQTKEERHEERRKIRLQDAKLLGKKFWILMIVVTVFMLGRFSEIFISLHACDNFSLNVAYGTSITLIYNLVSTFVSYPVGKMSDRMDRTTLLLIGFILLFVAHITIGFAANLTILFIGTIIWGLQIGITNSILATLVSDYVPKDLRGTGFGVYYLIISISTAIASAFAGILSEAYGEARAFAVGAVLCLIALIMLCGFKRALKIVHIH